MKRILTFLLLLPLPLFAAEEVRLDSGLAPDKTTILLGEPLFMTFWVSNRTSQAYHFVEGGDNRGSVRHNNYRITATDTEGDPVPDPFGYNHFGGMAQRIEVTQAQPFKKRLLLNQSP